MNSIEIGVQTPTKKTIRAHSTKYKSPISSLLNSQRFYKKVLEIEVKVFIVLYQCGDENDETLSGLLLLSLEIFKSFKGRDLFYFKHIFKVAKV